MAWSTPVSLGTGVSSKTDGTTVVQTTSVVAEVGKVIVVTSAWDADDASNGQTTHLSCADSVGNTYVRAREHTNGNGADAGVTVGIFYCLVTTELPSGGTITVTNDVSQTAKAVGAAKFTKGTGSVVSVAGTSFVVNNATDPSDVTISGLASREYLWLWGMGAEGPQTDAYTFDADYSASASGGTTGGAADSNMHVRGRNRIFIGTTDTVETTSTTADRDYVQVFVALAETYVLSADPGSYAITGSAAGLPAGRKVAADPGAYAITGQAANLVKSGGAFTLAADPGSYALTGLAAGLRAARLVSAVPGAYGVTGQAAGLRAARQLIAANGGYGLIGSAAELLAQRKVAAVPGAYSLTGQAAGLRAARKIPAVPGVYSVTGSPATLIGPGAAFTLGADPGSYAITGSGANLKAQRRVAANPGAYGVSGQAAGLRASRRLSALAGAYGLTGQIATLRPMRLLSAQPGTYALTGMSTSLRAQRKLLASTGAYLLTGQAATLSFSGAGSWVTAVARPGASLFTTTITRSGTTTAITASRTTTVITKSDTEA